MKVVRLKEEGREDLGGSVEVKYGGYGLILRNSKQ